MGNDEHRQRGAGARIAMLLAAGFVLGPLLDQIHVRSGVLWYAHKDVLDQALWVAPQFAVAFVLIEHGVHLTSTLRRTSPSHTNRRRPLAPAWQAVLFVLAYATTGLLHEWPVLVACLLGALLVVRALRDRYDRVTWAATALLAVVGTTYEASLVHVPGAFSYNDAVPGLGVPMWLPLLYAHAVPFVEALSTRLRDAPPRP